jgi:hypothetical protein
MTNPTTSPIQLTQKETVSAYLSSNPTIRPTGGSEVASEDNFRMGDHFLENPELTSLTAIEPRSDLLFLGGTRLPPVKSE